MTFCLFCECKNRTFSIMERLTWTQYFCSVARLTSMRSPCERLKVGCVFVRDNRILCTGYNGYLPGLHHQSYIENDHDIASCHAELNALSNACRNGICTRGASVYVTHFPCVNCFKTLVSAGIVEIFYLKPYKVHPLVIKLSSEAGILIEQPDV